jgi:signal transduction histidine kinase
LTGDAREALDGIRVEAVRTKCLIEDLMTLAHADSGQVSVQSSILDLSETVQLACNLGEVLAKSKHIEFTARIPQKSFQVRGDSHALSRLFTILIDNAVKYTPDHGRVSVSLAEANSDAMCEIADSGIGMSEEELPHIFERFYRADRARSRERGGAGLGLAIARSITRAHGGTIEVESTPGLGSAFRARIPIATSCAGLAQNLTQLSEETASGRRSPGDVPD